MLPFCPLFWPLFVPAWKPLPVFWPFFSWPYFVFWVSGGSLPCWIWPLLLVTAGPAEGEPVLLKVVPRVLVVGFTGTLPSAIFTPVSCLVSIWPVGATLRKSAATGREPSMVEAFTMVAPSWLWKLL